MPSHPLKTVRSRILSGDVRINADILQDAWDDFGWDAEDIKNCLLRLKEKHCYNTAEHRNFPGTMIDFYRARNIMNGEDVYTHFYIIKGETKLIVNSFHEL